MAVNQKAMAVNQTGVSSNPVCGAKYLPLRVHPHFRLTARGHVAAEMANIGGIGLSRRERRWRQKGRNRLPAVRRRPVSQSLRVGLPFWLTANCTVCPDESGADADAQFPWLRGAEKRRSWSQPSGGAAACQVPTWYLRNATALRGIAGSRA